MTRTRLPGNRIVRRRRSRAETFTVRRRRRVLQLRLWMVPASFAAVSLLGTAILALPISSESGEWTHPVDAFFTAVSAVCVTGLTRFDTADQFSFLGEATILLLFQAGGLGVTMYAGLVVLAVGGRLGLRGREFFGVELLGGDEIDAILLIRRVVRFMLTLEVIAFVLLLPWFMAVDSNPAIAVWRSLFTAFSAVNNAGFDLMGGGDGFTGHTESPYPLFVMGMAAFLGSLSFLTIFNLAKPPKNWTLDTRLVVIGMAVLLIVGMLVFVVAELRRFRHLDPIELVTNAFFLSVNRTTGMSSIDMTAISDTTTLALMVMMFIGGASNSVAGGIKIGTFMVTLIAVTSGLRGRNSAQVFGREIPQAVVLRAMAIAMLGFGIHSAGTWAIHVTDDVDIVPLLFDVMSALANVGWSQGVAAELSEVGAVIMSVLMFVGRLGPLIVVLTIPDRSQQRYRYPRGLVRIG